MINDFIGLFLGFCLGAIIVGSCCETQLRNKIIDKNAGEWQVDGKTGNKNFVIFEQKKKEVIQTVK